MHLRHRYKITGARSIKRATVWNIDTYTIIGRIEDVPHWWETEVLKTCKCGKVKSYNIKGKWTLGELQGES